MGISETLLDWYDVHAREMPWRIGPQDRADGIVPDPYKVWLSEVMLQQTTVAAVKEYFVTFTERWPTVEDLAAADDEEVMAAWAGLGYYARARNLLRCARVVTEDHHGIFPGSFEGLKNLPGIGAYTAAAVSAIAFDRAETVLDGNVERVMARFHMVETPLRKAKQELRELASQHTPDRRPGDYAQAIMDLGATICTPRSPACGICPIKENCGARIEARQGDFPRREAKIAKPTRYGIAYVAERSDGAVLMERRPDSGLLGGTLCFPTSDWNENPEPNPPLEADWAEMSAIRHTFTHFHLILRVLIATTDAEPTRGGYRARTDFQRTDLPGLMRKVHDAAFNGRGEL